ncbi:MULTISPECIES: PucR family transcriptional regulator [unclassified Solwaraspora]|uniref:PucR family transcriptional regulator n=1 Tax=unclassified Solwaraspora TaxID=2627926 RepID=UPI00259BCBF5|nr:PucR family transcriptional regulator [Solwaraspora sp. WMMA2056]WJK42758.1 helix-turn-helix domain-containing protein [Solwaraspora sp. WMMA2056]
MQADLQRIVDTVAARVGRPALIEDRRQRVVVYSEHSGPMDDVRRDSILRRHTAAEVVAWFRDIGIMTARAPVRTPACPELELLPRVCVPVRHRDLLLGFVWFIDADGTMSDTDIAAAVEAAADLAFALYRTNLIGELASQREAEAARTLLSDSPDIRDEVVRSLLSDGVVTSDGRSTALVAQPVSAPGQALDETTRIALEQALVATRRWVGTREALHLVRHDHGVLLLRDARSTGRGSPPATATQLSSALATVTDRLAPVQRVVVGLGQPRPRLADTVHSYAEALQAARVGVRLPALGPVVAWANLGIYRLLSQLDEDQLDVAGVHPGLARMLRDDTHRVLLETLEVYLDLAGNAHAAAEALRLHRTTLYYRLQRVEQLADTDLKDGNERLCLHLALKLHRLARPAQGGG